MKLVKAFFGGLFNKTKRGKDFNLSVFVILASIPVGVVGYLLRTLIEENVRTLWVVAFTMIFFSIILYVADRFGRKELTMEQMDVKSALAFGFGQMLSLLPGVSRSGASISFGLFAGFTRAAAARFSFLIGIPAVLASGLYEFKSSYHNLDNQMLSATVVATITSFVVGYFVIAGLLKYLNRGSLMPFIVWRIVVGLGLLYSLYYGLISA